MTTLRETLITRGYELDHRFCVPPAMLARYQELSRWQAIESPELGLSQLFADGNKTVVRAQSMQLGLRIGHGVLLTLTLEVGHVGNASMAFRQRIARAADDATVSLARTTLVVLGKDGRPARVPDALRHKVVAGPLPDVELFDDAPPAHAFTRAVQVRPSDLDTLQHVNQARYIDYVDDTRQIAARAGAYGADDFDGKRHVKQLSISYERESVLGSELVATTWRIEGLPAVMVVLRDEAAGHVVARARLTLEA